MYNQNINYEIAQSHIKTNNIVVNQTTDDFHSLYEPYQSESVSNAKASGRRMSGESNMQLLTQANLATIQNCLNQSNIKKETKAIKSNYWELTPKALVEFEGNILNAYSAKVLNTKQTADYFEIFLNVFSRNGGKFTQAWVKVNHDQSDQLKSYSLGNEVILYIDPLRPESASIADLKTPSERIFVKTPLKYADEKTWVISTHPISNVCISLDGTDYFIYAGKVAHSNYTTSIKTAYSPTSDAEWMCHDLHIDIKIEGEETKHYCEDRHAEVNIINGRGISIRSPEDFDDAILKTLRHWKEEDTIKILVNQYYPGFWWIVNESRNEAAYIAQGTVLEIDHDLWSRLTN